MSVLEALTVFLRAWFVTRTQLAVENLALRQQLAVLKQSNKRPKLRLRHRVFWTWLMRLWPEWQSALIIVKPDTVVRWHRRGFRLYWWWKSRQRKPGRPAIEPEVKALIRRMSNENPTWGGAQNPVSAQAVGTRTCRKHGGQVQDSSSQTALTDVAYLLG